MTSWFYKHRTKYLKQINDYPNPSIPLCLSHTDVCVPPDSSDLGLPQRAQVVQFIVDVLQTQTAAENNILTAQNHSRMKRNRQMFENKW